MFRRLCVVTFLYAIIGALGVLIVYTGLACNTGLACPIKDLLNLNCPACGGSRMAMSIVKLDLYQAFRYNMYLFITAPFVIGVSVWQTFEYVKNNYLLKNIDLFLILYLIGAVIFMVLRNIPCLSFLLPTVV